VRFAAIAHSRFWHEADLGRCPRAPVLQCRLGRYRRRQAGDDFRLSHSRCAQSRWPTSDLIVSTSSVLVLSWFNSSSKSCFVARFCPLVRKYETPNAVRALTIAPMPTLRIVRSASLGGVHDRIHPVDRIQRQARKRPGCGRGGSAGGRGGFGYGGGFGFAMSPILSSVPGFKGVIRSCAASATTMRSPADPRRCQA
jgi:hypothetical protein